MRVDITAALNEHFKNDATGIPNFKSDKDNVAGIIKTDLFLNDPDKLFHFVSTKEAEFTEWIYELYPIFETIKDKFYLPAPNRVLADGDKPAAFIYPDLTFIVAHVKMVVENGT
jgi:hypothetical protein